MATETQQADLEALIRDIKGNIKTRLGDLMSKLLNSAEETLFTLAEEAPSNEQQARYFDLMRQLKTLKADIAADYITHLLPCLRPYPQVEADREKSSMQAEDELSLVEQSEIEDMVLVKNIAERAAGKYRDQLAHLEARLEHLALKTELIFPKDALRPVNFCQAFDDALGDHFDITNKKILFKLFSEAVADKLDSLYDSINNRLIDAGILPQIKLHGKAGKAPRRPQAPATVDEPPANDDEPQTYGDYAMTAAPGAAFGHRGGGSPHGAPAGHTPVGGVAGNNAAAGEGAAGTAGGGSGNIAGGSAQPAPASGSGQPAQAGGGNGGAVGTATGSAAGDPAAGAGGDGIAGGGAGGSAGGGNAAAGGAPLAAGQGHSQPVQGGGDRADASAAASDAPAGGYSHTTAGLPANQVSRALGQFFGAPILPAGEAGDSDAANTFAEQTASTPQFYGHDEILRALSRVQANTQFAQPDQLKFDGEAIKQALLEDIAKQSGGAVTKRINQIAAKTIDFIELIFDAIIDDDDISDTIKALLLRLQIPVIKASMADPEFFIYDDHPARVLLDKIADVGVGVTDHDDPVYIRLDKIVTRLINDFDLQTSSFKQALDELNAFIGELEEAARKKEEEAQRQVLREHARNTVLKALRSVTAGKVLPEGVHPLVLKRWPTLMFNHYLEFGKENDEWVTILEILRDIIESVQPIETAEDLAHLKVYQHELVDLVRHHLSKTNQSTRDIDNVIQGLIDTHSALIQHADFPEKQVEQAEEVAAGDTEKSWLPPLETEPDPDKPELPANVMPGMWFRVYMGEDSPARRCKLSVIIVEDANLVFVNHAGEIVVEKHFDEFRDELDNELSSVIMGHSVFDHALNSVITRLAPAS